jgi:MFS family permease
MLSDLAHLESLRLTTSHNNSAVVSGTDSPYAWVRLAASVAFGTAGGVGMWSMPVVLPSVQAEFGVLRADASLPFTLTMLGFAFGGVAMGRLQDRFGILVPALLGVGALSLGFFAASISPGLWTFALSYMLIGVGASATFGPIMTDVSFWFTTRRGIAVAIAAAGNYVAGTIWPPVIQHAVAAEGWRPAHADISLACLAIMLPLLFLLRRPAPRNAQHRLRPRAQVNSTYRQAFCRHCFASQDSLAASQWQCPRSISWPIAATSVTASRAAPRCCR